MDIADNIDITEACRQLNWIGGERGTNVKVKLKVKSSCMLHICTNRKQIHARTVFFHEYVGKGWEGLTPRKIFKVRPSRTSENALLQGGM